MMKLALILSFLLIFSLSADAQDDSIYIYLTGDGLSDYLVGDFIDLENVLENAGYTVTIEDASMQPELIDTEINLYDQLWIFTTDYNQSNPTFTSNEITLILETIDEGKGFFLASDHDSGYVEGANEIAGNFGISFNDRIDPDTAIFEDHPLFAGVERLSYLSESHLEHSGPYDFIPLASYNDSVMIAALDENGIRCVFDGCFMRLHDDNIDNTNFDNSTYILNIAAWLSTRYQFLPGDANMAAGLWPPQVIGADVTYLVNYFRAMSAPCNLGGFYAAGDVNGDCLVIGSDVTYLVGTFRGVGRPRWWCPDYPPSWPTRDDLPVDEPEGWPNCD